MIYLLLISLLWALSAGIIQNFLGGVDRSLLAAAQLGIALLLFLPFFRPGSAGWRNALLLAGLGAVQFGLASAAFLRGASLLPGFPAAALAVTTPLYVVGFDLLFKRRWRGRFVLGAALAAAGAALILYPPGLARPGEFGPAVVYLQVACAAFALGQVGYKRWRRRNPGPPHQEVFAALLLGGFIFAGANSASSTDWDAALEITSVQWALIAFLGLVATGAGLFFWNIGAARTNAGTLAALNHLPVPLAVFVSLFFFETLGSMTAGAATRLAAGSALIAAAVVLGEMKGRPRARNVEATVTRAG